MKKKNILIGVFFIICLILVSIIKNETRNVQKEINNFKVLISKLENDLHLSTLELEFVASPENISALARKYLEEDFIAYKSTQIKHFSEIINNPINLVHLPLNEDEKE